MDVKVLKFSLGFGRQLIGRKIGETEYQIAAFPLGGYVKMFGEESGEEMRLTGEKEEEPPSEEDLKRTFRAQPVWKRFLIVLAGPVFNVLFGALIFMLIYTFGAPDLLPYLGKADEKSPAARAGLIRGDKILEVDGIAVNGWISIWLALDENEEGPHFLKIERDGNVFEKTVTPERKSGKDIFGEEKEAWTTGLAPLTYPLVGEVVKGDPADKAGLVKGDRILEIDGNTLDNWGDVVEIIHNSPGKPLNFKVQRSNERFDVVITPKKGTIQIDLTEEKEVGLIGIRPMLDQVYSKFPPLSAVKMSVQKTIDSVKLTFVVLVKVIQRKVAAEKALGGPISIVKIAGESDERGIVDYLLIMAYISIGLGIINLFPIPILDGGHIIFLTYEGIFRKPLRESIVAVAQRVGLFIIIMLIIFIFYIDWLRIKDGVIEFFTNLMKYFAG
jgi:regulator of sigma E protease